MNIMNRVVKVACNQRNITYYGTEWLEEPEKVLLARKRLPICHMNSKVKSGWLLMMSKIEEAAFS